MRRTGFILLLGWLIILGGCTGDDREYIERKLNLSFNVPAGLNNIESPQKLMKLVAVVQDYLVVLEVLIFLILKGYLFLLSPRQIKTIEKKCFT